MPPHEPSELLVTVEVIHWIALGVMGAVYVTRLWWLLSYKGAVDRSPPGTRRRGARFHTNRLLGVPVPHSTARMPASRYWALTLRP